MISETIQLADEAATEALGAALAKRITCGVVWLQGDLGAGKTTLVRGWLRALGHVGAVKSPTYTIVEPYQFADVPIYHFDLYRLSDPEELEMIGGRDYFDRDALCLVEWPQQAGAALPEPALIVSLTPANGGREATLTFPESGQA
ncbi:tRNA (adenosine(37)-N6)-threonylcarbamoyltransferase complex ATPase subunit type 1 TsaE [Alcanivorax sp. 1008]|uniref:tRNA (adenosine(37)-N6)-threonylcarbamoyltransferase complex ATPase subunit type 1 TsaE n=1 Tax=Alcanivorax sp. 1008 TaxID=2816853 RepID=UPI001D757DF6|nr:tRNA (adenosine(37)-N6)-threonylcarbamoyltransferase complex ATPase subunit type 1 TsaE [Alcanivorax sp. 1008]